MTTLAIIRDRPLPTMSAWDRVMKCGAEQQLMHVRSSSEYAERGTAVHLLLEHAYSGKTWEEAYAIAAAAYPQHKDTLANVCAGQELYDTGHGWTPEAPLILDIEAMTVRRPFNAHGHRDYGKVGPFEIAGTLDLVHVTGDKREATLRDWKTGRYVVRAGASWQLRIGAIALVCLHSTIQKVTVEIGWFNDEMEPRFDAHSFTRDELYGHAARVLKKAKELRSAEGVFDVTTGSWCKYCPAYAACPGTGALMRKASDVDGSLDAFRLLLQEDKRKAYDLWRSVAALSSMLEDEIKNAASIERINLGNGKAYGYREVTRKAIEGVTAYKVMAERYGDDLAKMAVGFVSTQVMIDNTILAARQAGHQFKSMAGEKREIMAALDIAGGVKKNKQGRVDTFNVGDSEYDK